ncbi:MAG: hypothetical protein E7566_05470 [Ruminococcaceae bacterium]|nr:hypothetical protein [Oscillospiraceae bacterium]
MSMKFIGVEGYGEIKSLDKKNQKNNSKNNISTAKKLVRFIKRIPKEVSRDLKAVKKKLGDITWSTLTPKKFFKGIRHFHLSSSYFESMRSPKGIATLLAPITAAVVLILTICFWTLNDSPLQVSVDGKYIATIENENVLTKASAQMHNALSKTTASETSTPLMQIGYPSLNGSHNASVTEVYEKLVDSSDAVVSQTSGLYIDDVFYGATQDKKTLTAELTKILNDAKARYDETTTTTFENDVKILDGVYAADSIKSTQEIIESAKLNLSIRLETDLTVEYDRYFTTIYEYDESQLDTYCEVKQQGKPGKESVLYRLVYIDGVQTDSIVQSTELVEEPVDQILVVGTRESYSATGSFTWPVPYTKNVTSVYEYRWGTFHNGIDISWNGIYGQDIVASDSGTVTWAGYDNSGYGYYVIIDHGNGFQTMYAHACELYVETGDKVLKGEAIAGVGSTGYSTGDHLHFEIIKDGVQVDPELYTKGETYIDG